MVSYYKEFDGGKVYLGDDSHLNIIGCGKVKIKFPDGRITRINGVLHIPSLAQNLLFVQKIINEGV